MQDHFFPARPINRGVLPTTTTPGVAFKDSLLEGQVPASSSKSGATFHDYVEQAGICCERARDARDSGRMEAARGLYSTAISLCQHALGMCAASSNAVHESTPSPQHATSQSGTKVERDDVHYSSDNEAEALIQLSRAYSEMILCHR